jgi:hypothetical protein
MPKWAVRISQFSKVGGTYLNTFDFTVDADTKALASPAALKELEYWSQQQPIHVDEQEYMKLQLRPIHKLTWKNARNVIISVKRVK